jgi:transcriptional regulator with XRE-family HTH domain
MHVRNLRTLRGLSQEGLANEADVPISQVGRIERGEINPTLSTLNALAEAFKMSLHDFLKM